MQYRPYRYPTQFPIQLFTASGNQKAQIIDVHNEGAQLRGPTGASPGDKVQLDVLSHRVDATVKWVMGDKIGIAFRPQISDHLLDTIRQRVDGRAMNGRSVVGFGFSEMR